MQNEKSLRGGNNKRQAQKHQNRTSFKPLFNERLIKLQQNAPLDHLCERCVEQIKWKLKFCKYKVIKDPHTCVKCDLKNIVKSYRHCCDKCSNLYKICAKCMEKKDKLEPVRKEEKKGVDNALLRVMQEYLKTLRERSRRKIMRLIKEKKITFNQQKSQFEYIEDGEPLQDLQFKGFDDLNDSLDFLEDGDEDEDKNQNQDIQDEDDENGECQNILNSNKQKQDDKVDQDEGKENEQEEIKCDDGEKQQQNKNSLLEDTEKQMGQMQIKGTIQINKQ